MTASRFTAPHLREPVFREYEDTLAYAVAEWPKETSFDLPAKRKLTTYVANFRNAILSLRAYRWPSRVDLDKLNRIQGQYQISPRPDGRVWFCTRRTGAPSVPPSEPTAAGVVPWRDATDAEIIALCTLIHHGRLAGPFIIVGEVDVPLRESLTTSFNVGMVFDEEQKQTIIT